MTRPLAVDIIILRGNGIVAIKRKFPPFLGKYAQPGGFVEDNETVEEAAIREAKEETNLDVTLIKTVGVYSDPGRDPRGGVVSVCFLARGTGKLQAGDDAKEAEVVSKFETNNLAFDHSKMVLDSGVLDYA